MYEMFEEKGMFGGIGWEFCGEKRNGGLTTACSCQDKSKTLGREKSRKFVNVVQWVSSSKMLLQVPPSQSLASRLVGNLTCKPSNGSTELRGTRVQAALLSLEIGIVVVSG